MSQPIKEPMKGVKPEDQALALLADKNMITQIGAALPKHFAPDRMIRIAMTELRKTPKLRLCDPFSFLGAIMQCAQLGLEPGSGLGHAYLIPYGKECTMITGYKGHVELMRRSGQVTTIFSELVRKGDLFKYGVKNGGPYLDWEPGSGEAGFLTRIFNRKDQANELTHVFATGTFKSGGMQYAVMDMSEVDAIRDVVLKKAFKPEMSPWNNFYGEMAKKTAIRRLAKLMPQSPEYVRIQELDDAADAGRQFRMTLQPLIEAGIVDPNYDPEPEKQAPIETPADKAKAASTRAEIIAEFDAAWNAAKAKGLKLGDALKMLGVEVDKIRSGPLDEIETATDILTEWTKGKA